LVELRAVKPGKYQGRWIAEVWHNGINLSEALKSEGLGRDYRGGKRKGWCD